MPVQYKKVDGKDYTTIEFDITGNILKIEDLQAAVNLAPDVDYTKGVCVSGRGTAWLFSALTEKYHPASFFSTFDPRMGGCVVTASQAKGKSIGSLVGASSPLKYQVRETDDLNFVEFEITDGDGHMDVSKLDAAMKDVPKDLDYTKGVCASGRGPLWLFSALTQKYHHAKFFSTYDPRAGGCIITAMHDPITATDVPERKIGDLVKL